MYSRQEESDSLVTTLANDKDAVLRRSGMYTISMAYCGTGNNQAIRKLLHVAVSITISQLLIFTKLVILYLKKKRFPTLTMTFVVQLWLALDFCCSGIPNNVPPSFHFSLNRTIPMFDMELQWHWELHALARDYARQSLCSSQWPNLILLISYVRALWWVIAFIKMGAYCVIELLFM